MKPIGILLISLVMISCALSKKSGESSKKTVEIKTSAECDQCKKRLEEDLNYTKGVSFAELDIPSKVLTVKFDAEKITLKEIKDRINKLGYDADEQKAPQEAVRSLPACCQPGGMEH